MADLTQYPHAMYEDAATGKAMPQNAVTIIGSAIKAPIEIQGRTTKPIITHNAVLVTTSNGSYGIGFFSCDGFDKIAAILKSDAAVNTSVSVDWSHDGVTLDWNEVIAANTNQTKGGILDIKAPFCRVFAYNSDAASHTITVKTYLR
jgi:hypothetical protein